MIDKSRKGQTVLHILDIFCNYYPSLTLNSAERDVVKSQLGTIYDTIYKYGYGDKQQKKRSDKAAKRYITDGELYNMKRRDWD